MKKDIVTNIIEFTGYTTQGDEVIEWQDGELDQHAVQINRERRGLTDISFYFRIQSEAHALFLALCQAEDIRTDWDEAQLLVAEEAEEDARAFTTSIVYLPQVKEATK